MATVHKKHRPVFQQEAPREVENDRKVVETPVVEDFEALFEGKIEAKTTEGEWKLLSHAQQNGKTYLVTHDPSEGFVEAFWRKTRVLSHYKWVLNGKWTLVGTRADVLPQPTYYRELGQ